MALGLLDEERVEGEDEEGDAANGRHGLLRDAGREHAPAHHRDARAQSVADDTAERDAVRVLRAARGVAWVKAWVEGGARWAVRGGCLCRLLGARLSAGASWI